MTREQIEKAAKETLVNEPVEIQATKVGAFQHGFITGAQWRINSVWHDVHERPDSGRVFLYIGKSLEDGETKFDTDCLYTNENWEDFVFGEAMEEWAYLDDLIPERKEETE